MPKVISASRGWVFTLNNPDAAEEATCNGVDVQYSVFQMERGENGTEHFQGYFYFACVKRLSAVRRILPRAHWEPRMGSHDQAVAYCTKEDTRVRGPYEKGSAPVQGKRSDLSSVKDMIDGGASIADVAEEHFSSFVRYHRGLQLYMDVRNSVKVRNFQTELLVLYGAPGTGKTSWVLEFLRVNKMTSYWLAKPVSANQSIWWDEYSGQDALVLDEFNGFVDFTTMTQLVNLSPFSVSRRGRANAQFVSRVVIIISNRSPSDWWPRTFAQQRGLGAMCRRLVEPIGGVACVTSPVWVQPPVFVDYQPEYFVDNDGNGPNQVHYFDGIH